MRDQFDEFLKELQRRQQGGTSDDATAGDRREADPATASEDDAPDDRDDLPPEPIRARRPVARPSPGGGRRGPGGPGGPDDGASFRDRFGRAGRRVLLVV